MFFVPANITSSRLTTFDSQTPNDIFELAANVSANDTLDFYLSCNPFHHFFTVFYIPMVIVVGLIGNALSCFVLLTTHLKMRSSSYYLAALSVSDFVFLLTVLAPYCSYNDIINIFDQEGFCQFFIYLSAVTSFVSVWLIVAFTTERFIAVRYPLRRQYICTVSRAQMIIGGITAVGLLSQVHLLRMAKVLVDSEDKPVCDMEPTTNWLLANFLNWLDTILTFIIPVTSLLIMNSLIGKLLFDARRFAVADDERVKFHHASSQSSDSTRLSDFDSTASRKQVKFEDYPIRCNRHPRSSQNQSQQNINTMLFIISSVFIILNFPSYIIRLIVYFGFTLAEKSPPSYLYCAQQFAQMLYYTNFSINFILYTLCGKSFRMCLKKMLKELFRRILPF